MTPYDGFTPFLKGYTFSDKGRFPNHLLCGCCQLHLSHRGRFLGKTAPVLRLGFFAHLHPRSSGLGVCPSRPGVLITA